jgi:hypothetical protein
MSVGLTGEAYAAALSPPATRASRTAITTCGHGRSSTVCFTTPPGRRRITGLSTGEAPGFREYTRTLRVQVPRVLLAWMA